MRLAFHTLDVFTERRFGGNPLAVVLGADALDTAQMAAIAREFNLSETVFVLKAENPMHSARMRIFTPGGEIPFAGHPTVGTAALLAELRTPAAGGERDAIVALEQQIGTVRVGVKLKPNLAAFAEFDAPKLPERIGEPAPVERLSAALGLLPNEIGFENHKPSRFTAGNAFVFVPVASLEAIAKAEIRPQHWAAASWGASIVGTFLYTRQCIHTTSAFHARMFAPDFGVPEDPATGSAAAAFAGVIQHFDSPLDGPQRRIIEQGFEMGRPSFIQLSLAIKGGRLDTVRIGGHAVPVMSGTLEV